METHTSAQAAGLSDVRQAASGKAAARDELIERGMAAVRELDPVTRNVFAGDAPNLSAWLSASRVERTPRPNRNADTQPPATGV